MEINRILWPTDFSENAGQALPLVTSLAEKYQAEIHILSESTKKEVLSFKLFRVLVLSCFRDPF